MSTAQDHFIELCKNVHVEFISAETKQVDNITLPDENKMTPKERLAFQILKTTLPPFQPFNTYQ